MNPDDFEQRLQRQPLRTAPSAWRAEILVAADVNRRSTATQPISEDQVALLAGWRLLFARLPLAWATLAALWVALIGVNLLLSGPAPAGVARSSAPAPADAMTVWHLQRTDSKLLASLLSESPDSATSPAPPVVPPRPRSDRWRDEGFGEIRAPSLFATLV